MMEGSFRRLMMRSGGSQLSDAAAFLASYGPFGMVMDFTDASIAINDEANTLDYSSVGTVHDGTGALLGPGSKLTYSAPSLKFTEQADGYIAGQAHNLCLQSETLTNASWAKNAATAPDAETMQAQAGSGIQPYITQNITVAAGPSYVLSFEAKAGTHTAFQVFSSNAWGVSYQNFDLGSGTVATGNISGATVATPIAVGDGWYRYSIIAPTVSTTLNVLLFIPQSTASTRALAWSPTGTETVKIRKVHVYRAPAVSTYVKTTSAAVYDLPYVFSGGLRTGIQDELAATNNASYSSDWTNAVWFKSSTVSTAKNATGPDNVANSASTLTFSGAGGIGRSITKGTSSVEAMSVYARRSGALSGSIYMNVSNATSGTSLVTGTDSDFSGAGNWVNRSDAGGNAIVTGGRLEISQGASSLEKGRAELALTGLTIGRVYRVLVDATGNVVGSSAQGVQVYTGANLTGTQVCNLSVVGALNQNYHFVATETTMYLVFTTTGAGNTFTFAVDDVEVFAMTETDVTSQITTSWARIGEVQAGSVQNPAFSLRATTADAVEVALFQSETGLVVTSPIPTYAAAVTRAADTFYILTSLFPSSILTFSVYCNYVLPSPSFNYPCPIQVYQASNTTGNRTQIYHAASGANYNSSVRVNSSLGASIAGLAVGSAFAPLISVKAMFAVQAGSNAACINGGTVATDAAAVVFADLDRLSFSQAGAAQPNGLIKAIAYFPERKANATLQTMTTA